MAQDDVIVQFQVFPRPVEPGIKECDNFKLNLVTYEQNITLVISLGYMGNCPSNKVMVIQLVLQSQYLQLSRPKM